MDIAEFRREQLQVANDLTVNSLVAFLEEAETLGIDRIRALSCIGAMAFSEMGKSGLTKEQFIQVTESIFEQLVEEGYPDDFEEEAES